MTADGYTRPGSMTSASFASGHLGWRDVRLLDKGYIGLRGRRQ
jgi:hypothetical protein